MNDREAQLEAKVSLLEEKIQEMALQMLSMDSEYMELSEACAHERMLVVEYRTRLDAVLALAQECEDSPSFAERGMGRLVRAAATGDDQ